jgi:putative nucleotidyltransferase with HDIG domain
MKKRMLVATPVQMDFEILRRRIGSIRPDWKLEYAESSRDVRATLGEVPCEILIADSRLEGMVGGRLLEETARESPQTARILLADAEEKDSIFESVDLAHQILNRLGDDDELEQVLKRAEHLQEMLEDPALRHLIAQVGSLPSLPEIYVRIVEELDSPDPSIRRVGEIVAEDLGLAAKTLQIANSAMFGTRVKIGDPVQAVVFVGLDMTKSIVLAAKLFSASEGRSARRFGFERLWTHSLRVATFAREICKLEGIDREHADGAFSAGMLHDVGKIVLGSGLPESYGEVVERVRSGKLQPWEAEREVFGATHCEVGAYLTGLWGLPESIVEILLHHHAPYACPDDLRVPLAAVHVGNAVEHLGEGIDPDAEEWVASREYLGNLGLTESLSGWREA